MNKYSPKIILLLQFVTILYISLHYESLQSVTIRYNLLELCEINTFMWSVTTRYDSLQLATIRYNSLQFVTLRPVTMRNDLFQFVTLRYNPLKFVTIVWNKHLRVICYNLLQFVTTRYDSLQFVTIRYITTRYDA